MTIHTDPTIVISAVQQRSLRRAPRMLPWVVLSLVLVAFVAPIFLGERTLTNFSDFYVLPPWNRHAPPGWYHSKSIDGSPIYFFNQADLLNRQLLSEGKLFAWNPYNGFGSPVLAAMQAAPYFPFKLIPLLWPDYWTGSDLLRIVLFLTAGAGSYLLLRSLGARWEAALFSGLAYMLSQRLFMVVNMPAFQIESLLPMMLFAINEMVKRRSMRWAAIAGLIGGSQLLGGFPEASFIFGVVAAAFWLWAVVYHADTRAQLKLAVGQGLLVAVIAVGIGGFQIGEFVRYLPLSTHVHTEAYGSVVKRPLYALAMMSPNLLGQPFSDQLQLKGLSGNDHMIYSVFCGVSSLMLALIAIVGRLDGIRHHKWFFLALFVLFAGYDYGAPVLVFLGRLPLFNLMSTAWNAFVMPFSATVLAGLGLHALMESKRPLPILLAIIIYSVVLSSLLISSGFGAYEGTASALMPLFFILPAFVAFSWLASTGRFHFMGASALIALVAAESYYADSGLGYLHFRSELAKLPSLAWITENVGHERIFGVGGIYPANMLNPSRVRDIRHLDAMYPTIYVDYVDAIWPGARANVYEPNQSRWTSYDDPLLDLAAIRYIVTTKPIEAGHLTEAYKDADVAIYANQRALPRARFETSAQPAPSGLTPTGLRSASGLLLEGYGGAGPATCESVASDVRYLEDDPNQIRLRVTTACPGFLVLADTFFPGWKAYVDERETTIYRANYAFRAVEVPQGEHTIAFAYDPWTLQVGTPLALLTAVAASVVALRPVRGPARQGSERGDFVGPGQEQERAQLPA